jgi:hypothetical protein
MNLLTDSEQEFVEAFESCRLPNEQFHHRDHLRVTWIYLGRYGNAETAIRLRHAIRAYAAHHGKAEKYHETVTQAWVQIVASAREHAQGASFDEMLAANPELLDKRLIEKYYSPKLLHSDTARLGFVAADREPLPSAA